MAGSKMAPEPSLGDFRRNFERAGSAWYNADQTLCLRDVLMLQTAEKIACAVREFISGTRHASMSRLLEGRLLTSSNFLLPAFSRALFATAMLLTIIIVDPYGLRPWGVPIHLKDGNYPGSETTRLLRSITSHRQDVVLIGGSPMMPITPSLLREEFGVQWAANLAYEAPTWQDTSIV